MKGIYRSFTVEGLNLERFIRLTMERDITFQQMKRSGKRLSGLVDEDSLDMLMALAVQGGWRFVSGGRSGAGKWLEAMKRKWLLGLMLVLGGLMVIISTQVMLGVEICDAGVYAADIADYLKEQNIRPVMLKHSVDLNQLRDDLEWRYPHIAWADCGWRGMTLRIRMVTGTPLGDTLTHNGAGDVIALRDGIVESIVTVAGTPQVQAGDVVRRGQLLIKGEERAADETTVAVMARGTVMARVWDGAAVRMNITEKKAEYTGNEQSCWTVRCPWFSLWGMPETAFDHQDVLSKTMPLGGLFFPLSIHWENCLEVTLSTNLRDVDEIKAEAGEAAMRLLRQKIGFDDDLVDKWVDYCMIENEVVEAVAVGERLIDIAQPQRGGS